jgi:hypothetical protein
LLHDELINEAGVRRNWRACVQVGMLADVSVVAVFANPSATGHDGLQFAWSLAITSGLRMQSQIPFRVALIKPDRFAGANYFTWGFHSRARRCASAICAGVIFGAIKSSAVTSKAAIRGHFKTGHREGGKTLKTGGALGSASEQCLERRKTKPGRRLGPRLDPATDRRSYGSEARDGSGLSEKRRHRDPEARME